MTFEEAVSRVGLAIDAVGVTLMAAAIAVALARFAVEAVTGDGGTAYRVLRRRLGRAILVALEILVAADIVRTVAIDRSFRSIGILAGIVLIRTFLSMTLEVELSGEWPWRRRGGADPKR